MPGKAFLSADYIHSTQLPNAQLQAENECAGVLWIFQEKEVFEMCDEEDVENDWGKAVLPTAYSKSPPLDRRYSISTVMPQAEVSRNRMTNLSAKVQKLKNRVSITQEDCLELRQQVSDLQE
jgi:hypothetical protein